MDAFRFVPVFLYFRSGDVEGVLDGDEIVDHPLELCLHLRDARTTKKLAEDSMLAGKQRCVTRSLSVVGVQQRHAQGLMDRKMA